MALAFKVWDGGEDTCGGDSPAVRATQAARKDLEEKVARLGGTVDFENHGIQAGDHVTLIVNVAMGLPGMVNASLELVAKLRTYLKRAREVGASHAVAVADQEALQLLAYDEVRRSNSTFRTDPDLVQVMTDGARKFAREAAQNESCEGFPVGTFLFRVPDLDSGRTHTIEICSDGRLLDHRVRDELTADALAYLQDEATK